LSIESLVKRTGVVGVEIIVNEPDLDSVRKMSGQYLHKFSIFDFPALVINNSNSFSRQRLNGQKQAARAIFFILVMLLINLPWLEFEAFDSISDEKTGAFVKTNHGILLIIRQAVKPQDILHGGDKNGVNHPDAAGFCQVGFDLLFFKSL
jgi:hypothetical protein